MSERAFIQTIINKDQISGKHQLTLNLNNAAYCNCSKFKIGLKLKKKKKV